MRALAFFFGLAAAFAAEPSGRIFFHSAALGQWATLDVRSGVVAGLGTEGSGLAVSPDGRHIAYLDNRDHLHVRDLAGGGEVLLSDGTSHQYSPTFVGNDAIAYLRETRRGTDICLSPIVGLSERAWPGKTPFEVAGGVNAITWVPGSNPSAPSFVLKGRHGLHFLSPAGSRLLVPERGEIICRYPSVSPDGRQVVYVQDDGRYYLYLVDLAGGAPRKLTQDGDSSWPAWSPDGQYIAFTTTSAVSRGLAVKDVNSGQTVGRTAGFFLNRIAIMKPDGGVLKALTDPQGKTVNATGSAIIWR